MRAVDTETASAAIAMLALAIQRRLERGTTDEEIDALIERYRRDAGCSSRSTRSSSSRRAGGSAGAPRSRATLLNVKPILAIEDGEVAPIKRVRGNQKALQEFQDDVRGRDGIDDTNLRVGIAHAEAPDR